MSDNETGIFPSFTNRGKRRKAGDFECVEYRLRGLKDGMLRSFIDDGRSPESGENNQARQELLRKLTARDRNGVPLFYADKKLPPVPGPGGLVIEVAVINDEIKAAQAEYMRERDENARSAMEQVKAKYDDAAALRAAALAPEAVAQPKPRRGRPKADA